MSAWIEAELNEALKAFSSSISKCEKAQEKLKDGSWQKAFTLRQLDAFYIAVNLIENALENETDTLKRKNQLCFQYSHEQLQAAAETLQTLTEKCKHMQAKFKEGSPQRTLADRRLKAFDVASSLIDEMTQNSVGGN